MAMKRRGAESGPKTSTKMMKEMKMKNCAALKMMTYQPLRRRCHCLAMIHENSTEETK